MTTIRTSATAWRFAAVGALLTLALAAAYLPLRHNGFVNFDDDRLILDNPVLRDLSPDGLEGIFTLQLFTPHYKPLVNLSWAAELRLFGPEPGAFHRHNLMLHLLNTVLVLGLAALLSPTEAPGKARLLAAVALAAIWALHPMKVESVAWAAERKDLLFAAFYLGAMLSYLRYVDGRRRSWLTLSSLLALGGVLCKSTAITLPLALLLIDLWRRRRWSWERLVEKLPHLAVAALALYLYGLLPGPGEAGSSLALLAGNDPIGRLTAAGHRHLAFAAHWLAPIDLAVLYPVPDFLIRPGWLRLSGYILVHLLLLAALLTALRRRPRVAAASLFFSTTLLPTLVAPISTTNYLSDRYTYLPSLGLAALLVLAVAALYRSRPALRPVLGTIAVSLPLLLGLLTYRQIGAWRNSEELWNHVLAVQPPHPFAYNNRGAARLQRDDSKGALADFNRALALRPGYAAALANRADLLRKDGRPDAALADLDRAIELEPRHGRLYRARGLVRVALAGPSDGITDYTCAIDLDPTDAEAFYLRAQAHRRGGELDAAYADIDQALTVLRRPTVEAHLLRALILAEQGRLRDALDDTTRAIDLDPYNPVAFNNRGFLLLQLEEPGGALADLDRALSLRPGYPLALRSRGDALASLGNDSEACLAWRAAADRGAPGTTSRLAPCPGGVKPLSRDATTSVPSSGPESPE